ncbi:hypothetical protein [Cohnella nanjingensis]|uniref:Uncharacterized protein n=1 Tax=Cohnella nanjingensis TaxID=1387779 RepID=A0A7X0VEK2_9BACL|nr:hypothetical protein [Cohnella nanjingensis]MBB6671092.1 hypothetical protein [Cohnella nanjingensis]
MESMAILAVWLIGLFGLIGVVMAAVAQLILRDTMEYDKAFTWQTHKHNWDRE